jgi:hypothetical protein
MCLNSERAVAMSVLLARSDVDYIHVRDTDAGCYDFSVEK